jgi:hypothetical protein
LYLIILADVYIERSFSVARMIDRCERLLVFVDLQDFQLGGVTE